MRRAIVHFLWGGLAFVVAFCLMFFIAVWNGWVGYMPDMDTLSNPIDKFATQIYSANGKLIGTWNEDNGNRVAVDYNSLSPNLVHALVATEDERFYEHSGIDYIALGRAIIKRGLLGHTEAGGGSTITQQLAKQLYSEKAHGTLERMLQKPIEWIIAIKLERYFTKEEIIALYLNYFDFLHNAVGIKRAANIYFNKEPWQLNLDESAMLIGMCKNPSMFNPLRYKERSLQRRNVVLAQMLKCGYISSEQYGQTSALPLTLHFTREKPIAGAGSYFQVFLKQYMMAEMPLRENYPTWRQRQYVLDSIAWATDPLYGWCNKNHKRNGDSYNVNTDGLRIFTTIDTRMQLYAEQAVREHVGGSLQNAFNQENHSKRNAPFSSGVSRQQIKNSLNRSIRQSHRFQVMKEAGASPEEIIQAFRTPVDMTVFTYHGEEERTMTPIDSILYYKNFLRSAFVSMDPHTGAVKAYVGGIDYDHFKYDMVMGGRRQVGSTIKPFLYALAMQSGMTPCSTVRNVQHSYGGWTPRNGSRARYGQEVTLKWALQHSNNWISASLITTLGPQQFVGMLHDFGLNNPDTDRNATPVLSLGPCEVSVGEMVSAYTAFANGGVRCAPLFVTKIEDSHGNVIAKFQPLMSEVISEENSYRMIDMMRAVINGGTGSRLKGSYGLSGDIAGKTGTTNDNSDGWFIAFTPELVSGAWVGGEDRDIHFNSTSLGQGAASALPIWAYFMKKVYADRQLGYNDKTKFNIPEHFDFCSTSDDSNQNDIQEVYF